MSSCYISSSAIELMTYQADVHEPLETGGILLGIASREDIWIEEAIGPGPLAKHEKSCFVPDHEYQERAIEAAYVESGHRIQYLGDWHTHPGGPLVLSRSDRRTFKAIARYQPARQPRPVMLILAGGFPWKLGVWRITRSQWTLSLSVDEMKRVVVAD